MCGLGPPSARVSLEQNRDRRRQEALGKTWGKLTRPLGLRDLTGKMTANLVHCLGTAGCTQGKAIASSERAGETTKMSARNLKDIDSIVYKSHPWRVINTNDCHHASNFAMFRASSHPSISSQLMGFLVTLEAWHTQLVWHFTSQGWACVSPRAYRACERQPRHRNPLVSALPLLTQPWEISQLIELINNSFLFFFFYSQLAYGQNVW